MEDKADMEPECHICGETITRSNSKLRLKPDFCTHYMCDDCIEDLILTDPDEEQHVYPCPFCDKTTTIENRPANSYNDHNGKTKTDNFEGFTVSEVNIDDTFPEQSTDQLKGKIDLNKATKPCSDGCIFCNEANNISKKSQNNSSPIVRIETFHTNPAYTALNNCGVPNSEVLASRASCVNGHQYTELKQCLLCENSPSLMSDNHVG